MSSHHKDTDYAIDAGLRLLTVLEALEGTNFEPLSIKHIQQQTGYSYDFCYRALKTLKVAGFATQTQRGWMVGTKILRFSTRFNDLCILSLTSRNSEKH